MELANFIPKEVVRNALNNFLLSEVIGRGMKSFTTVNASLYLNPIKPGKREEFMRDTIRELANKYPLIISSHTGGRPEQRHWDIDMKALEESAQEMGITEIRKIPEEYVNICFEMDLLELWEGTIPLPKYEVNTKEQSNDNIPKGAEVKKRTRGPKVTITNPSGSINRIMVLSPDIAEARILGFHRDFKFFMGGWFEVNTGYVITQFSPDSDVIFATREDIVHRFYQEPIIEGRV